MLLQEYWENPCGLLSIPWWKWKQLSLPPHIKILHHSRFSAQAAEGYRNQVYFQLVHDLKSIPKCSHTDFRAEPVSPEDAEVIASIINRSYPDIRVTEGQIAAMADSPAFSPALWVAARDPQSGCIAGCAIGEFDPESGEMSIEWVQVLPAFRRKGIGRMLVLELLNRVPEGTRFTTVSGQADNPSNPEKLYRSCGFTGTDYWHILTKEN